MPSKAKKYCKVQGCSNYATAGAYCDEHKPIHSKSFSTYHKWYMGKTWRRLRASKLKANPLCEICKLEGRMTSATEVHHVKDHKGDWKLFTDYNNLQALCKSCHSRLTMEELNRGRGV